MESHAPTSLALVAVLVAAPLGPPALGQGSEPAYVVDAGTDNVYRLLDLNGDGDWNDAGEVTTYRDETQAPTVFDVPVGIEPGPADVLYLCDDDRISRMIDLNLDGDVEDPAETETFFFGFPLANGSGVAMAGAQDLHFDAASGVLWVASNGGASLDDSIVRLEDLNADGDADDVGEALVYHRPAPGGALTSSLVVDVAVGNDGAVYYVENGSSLAKGVYRLEDLDASGSIDQPGEATPYYTPADLQGGSPTSLQLGRDGFWYLTDAGLDQVRRFADLDASGAIDAGVEDVVFHTASGNSAYWEIVEAGGGAWLLLEGVAPASVYRLRDANGDGTIDPLTEVTAIFDGALVTPPFTGPRGIAFRLAATDPLSDVCSGDGGDQLGCTDCPCGNNAPAGTVGGCLNSSGVGARLLPSGNAVLSSDTLHFDLSGAPAFAFCVLTSGDVIAPTNPANPCFGLSSGVQAVSFDGLRCAVGNTQRHGGRPADASGDVGTTTNGWGPPNAPAAGIGAQGGFAAGQVRFFQVVHREDPASVCLRGLNTSQAVSVQFLP